MLSVAFWAFYVVLPLAMVVAAGIRVVRTWRGYQEEKHLRVDINARRKVVELLQRVPHDLLHSEPTIGVLRLQMSLDAAIRYGEMDAYSYSSLSCLASALNAMNRDEQSCLVSREVVSRLANVLEPTLSALESGKTSTLYTALGDVFVAATQARHSTDALIRSSASRDAQLLDELYHLSGLLSQPDKQGEFVLRLMEWQGQPWTEASRDWTPILSYLVRRMASLRLGEPAASPEAEGDLLLAERQRVSTLARRMIEAIKDRNYAKAFRLLAQDLQFYNPVPVGCAAGVYGS